MTSFSFPFVKNKKQLRPQSGAAAAYVSRLDTQLRSAVRICSYVKPNVIINLYEYTEALLFAQRCRPLSSALL
jgi:hypothetical protein